MRFFLFFFFCIQITFAQVSKVTSYSIGSTTGQLSTSHAYTPNHSKYISTLQDMPTGALSIGIGVTKLNECDEVEWSNIYVKHAHPYSKAQITLEKGSDNIYVTSAYNTNGYKYLSVLKLDALGNVIFSKYYDFGNDLFSNDYTNFSTSSGGLVISAKYAPLGGGSSNTTLIHLDANGDLLNASKHYDTFSGISAAQVSDDTYIHRASGHMYQVKTNGQIEWAKYYGTAFQYSNFFNMVKQNDGYVMVISRSSEHFLAKVNLNGELLWVTDVKELSPFPPVIVGTKNNQIILTTYFYYNGDRVPLFITYDSDGNNLNESIISDIETEVLNYSSFSHTPSGHINLSYPSTLNNSVVYLQNVEYLDCKENISIPEVENLLDVSYTTIPGQSTPLTLNAVHDIEMTLWDLYVSDSVRCDPVFNTDSLVSNVLIDCTNGFEYNGNPNYTHYWPHDGSTDVDKTLDSVGTYIVEIENCFSKTTEIINVTSICGCTLNVPNAFTPNNDQVNDVFEIYDNCGIKSFEIDIYDRWGKRLFHSKDIENSWDGTYKGDPVKSDLYYYKIQYTPLAISSVIPSKIKDGVITVLY